jgi:hypothetical protein
MNELNVYYGESRCPFKLPTGWTLAHNVVPDVPEPVMGVRALTEWALAAPVSGPRLSELAGSEILVSR